MNLYLLTTKGLGDFHIIHKSASQAQQFLEAELSTANYGFSGDRKVTNINIVAEEIQSYKGELQFSSGNKLLISYADSL